MRGKRLTPEQIRLLMDTYRHHGYAAAKPLAIQFGVQPRYVASLARVYGIKHHSREVVAMVTTQKYTDKRWRWAVERGAIIA